MDVLKAIHNIGPRSTSEEVAEGVPSSQKRCAVSAVAVLDSDDEDNLVENRKRFGDRMAAFSYKTAFTPQQHANPVPSTSSAGHLAPMADVWKGRTDVKSQTTSFGDAISDDDDDDDDLPLLLMSAARKKPSKLSESLIPTLRSFVNCPLCIQPFPVLSLDSASTSQVEEEEVGAKKKRRKRKTKAGKAGVKKVQTGAERLCHVEICAFQNDTSGEMVMSLITRERIRLDRNQRHEYEEEIAKQGMWKTLTGDEPPSTQAQQQAVSKRGRRRFGYGTAKAMQGKKGGGAATAGKPKTVSTKGGKAKPGPSPHSFKAGRRGGLSRASTTVLAPHLTRSQVKQKCIELFGPHRREDDHDDIRPHGDIWSLYDDHDENTTRCRAAREREILLGLGVGACSRGKESSDAEGAIARLGMGNDLGITIAKRYKGAC